MDISRPPASPSPASGASGDLHAEALEALRALTGRADAQFHPGQFEAIEALVAERRRALVVQRTGWGKSAVYFLAALLQRRRGAGPALIVSPLLALMRDQVAAASRAGVRAEAINSANPTEWALIEQRLAADDVDVLLVSPERLVNPRFRDEQLPRLIGRCGLLVIDEAHCISDWGHDFRPDYRRLRDLVATLGPGVPVLATTATANGRVVADVAEQLGTDGSEVLTLRGPLTRDSLRLGCLSLPDDRSRLEYLVRHLDEFEGSGIIYTLTVSAAQDLAQLLDRHGRRVRAYTGRTDSQERAELEQALKDNEVKALAATSALGMGSTWAPRARRWPTTSRWAARAARPTPPMSSCSRGRRTAASGSTSRPRRCPARSPPAPCSTPSPAPRGRCRRRRSRPGWTSSARRSSCC